MRAHDAAEPARCAVHEEACEERLFPAQSRHDQGAQEGEEAGGRIRERADHHADIAHAVRYFLRSIFATNLTDGTDTRRPGTQEFIAQQLQIMAAMQAEHEAHAREVEERKLKRQQNRDTIPPVPALPSH